MPWLPGYDSSQPVRIGNAAHGQLQLDVFGEVIDALHQARRGGLRTARSDWAFQRALLEQLETVWHDPTRDLGGRGGALAHFTHSKVMAWVAFDRGIKAIEALGLDGPADRWRALRETIHAGRLRRRLRSRAGQLRSGLRLESARREPAPAADGRVSCRQRSSDPRHHRGRSSAA